MPSLSKFIDSAKNTFRKRKDQRRKSNAKSVRFSSIGSDSIFYTHSSFDYDRRSSISFSEANEAVSLKSNSNDSCDRPEDEGNLCSDSEFDEQVIRNTKVNKKQGYHSIAALITYRANI
ncbi:hypothetical protein K501DRAFT_47190 [Backusella circina FSU 941]|nr:hypothetical protein K501DRAFT_47190 [Backusella circina FSU 941]